MLAGEVNLQVNDIGGFIVHAEVEDPPYFFGCPDKTAINMFTDLIVTLHLK